MIDFTRAFDSAWERMQVILFRPFDFGKWCAIGLSAFLAGLLEGGNGINGSYNNGQFNGSNLTTGGGNTAPNFDLHQFNSSLSHALQGLQVALILGLGLLVMLVVLAILALVYWLGSRGEFMILDNIVRNRGAVTTPWQIYARQANSLFGFYLLLILVSFAVLLPFLGIALFLVIPLIQQQRWPAGAEIAGLALLGLLYFAFALVYIFVVFVFREFGVPLMFRQGLMARAAFWETMRLIGEHPGSIVVFALLRFAIFIGIAILSLIVCCATCCIGGLPYVGTVLMLPALIYVRCFTLDCLAQFGPRYDVWTVDVPAPEAGFTPPFSPPPPLG